MYKHIKDGYYIVHDETELKDAAKHYVYKVSKFESNSVIETIDPINGYPAFVGLCYESYYSRGYSDIGCRRGVIKCKLGIPVADLKAALRDSCEHDWTVYPGGDAEGDIEL